MSKTNVPAIPALTANNIQDVASAVKNLLDIREGLIGDPLDANVTYRDLVDAGIAMVNFNLGARGGNASPVYPSWGSEDGYDPTQDFVPPSKPTGFTVTGLFSAIQLQWDKSPDRSFAYTEIWRADNNVIGNATLIGTTDTRFYVDPVGTASTKYYWIRFVSQANVTGPFNTVTGTPGTAADDPTYVMGVLSDAYGVTSSAPFFQVNSDTTINGVTVHAGTYIKAAFIADATISNAMIKDAAINNAKIADLNAAKITAGILSADRIDAGAITGDKIAANTITAGKIDSRSLSIKDADGNVIFSASNNLALSRVSGVGAFASLDKISASNISTYISGAAIGFAYIADDIQSSDYNATNQTGWRIAKGGQMEMNNATFRGSLNVSSSSTSGSTQIKNNVIKVFDSAGTLRVKIGDLSA